MEIRKNFLPFTIPTIEDEEINAVTDVLKSGWLTTGKKVTEFEENICKYVSCNKAIGLTSCTAGLHIALAVKDIKQGDEVICPTYTFAATAHVITWMGAKPVLIDVNKDTFTIDANEIKKSITDKTKAIIPVHFGGHPCEMDEIYEIAEKYNLFVIEDSAHAIGSKYKNKMIGNTDHVSVFSFYAIKNITTAEGGMITTNDEILAEIMRRYSYFGINKKPYNRYSKNASWYYEIETQGYKYNMDNIHGALGVEQLKKINKFVNKRKRIASIYNEEFSNQDLLQIPIEKDYMQSSWHLYPILLNIEKLTISRNEFIEELKKYNIGTSVHFIPIHLHPFYQNSYQYKQGDFPISEEIYKKTISLPIYPKMTREDAIDVVDAVNHIIEENKK